MAGLSTRANSQELPPADPTKGTPTIEVLRGEAERDTWRIIEAFSGSALPFDLDLAWSAGSGAGAFAKLTVARSTRVSIFARSVRVAAINLADKKNRVGVTVADGFASTRNRWEYRGHHLDTEASPILVPPFADTLWVDLADPALLPLATVHLLDGLGLARTALPLNLQPHPGLPLGGASAIELVLPAEVDFRAVFHLCL